MLSSISISDLNRLFFIAAEKYVFPLDLGLKPLDRRGHAAFDVAGGEEQGQGQQRRLWQVFGFCLPLFCSIARSLYAVVVEVLFNTTHVFRYVNSPSLIKYLAF